MQDALAFIADLAAALARAHSARRVVEVLYASVAERMDATDATVWYATRSAGAGQGSGSGSGSGLGLEAHASQSGSRVVSCARSATRAGDEALDSVVRASFPEEDGYISIRSRGRAFVVEVDLLRAIAALVSTAMRHVEVLERVATLSRLAHGEARELRRKLLEHDRAGAGDIIAASPSTKRVLDEIVPAVARHDVTVLLRGATGTGKEIVARRIHALSARSQRAFVQLNCGAIPEALVESTLFGHERGAFTGAVNRHIGVFERAHLGTLLLDEIGDLPLSAQVKLLRVLQAGEIERVGGTSNVKVNVRVIAATNRALERMVGLRTFREDLFYRISVFPIELAPLRERPEDIDALTTALVARGAARMGRRPPAVSDAVRRKLHRHSWPGNVRELENVIERALLLSPMDELRLPFALTALVDAQASAEVEPLHAATKRTIERALASAGGRIYGAAGAAALLGLKPSTLQSKMKKLGIERQTAGPPTPPRP